ncbi:hypothetical protein B0T18DRAFT_405816 [Schizothecium vesticola]|uniref:Uncharacterized protein n=1 Tax=Schizothecium vesticola TaxID=314040 RepID=A0AA40F0Q0_9PEZI|nr:hypothetical protein B0T18DRAFT_405816 [Schizothecium vesticola]
MMPFTLDTVQLHPIPTRTRLGRIRVTTTSQCPIPTFPKAQKSSTAPGHSASSLPIPVVFSPTAFKALLLCMVTSGPNGTMPAATPAP